MRFVVGRISQEATQPRLVKLVWFLLGFVCVYRDIILVFRCFLLNLVVSTSATDCLERLVSEMTLYVSSLMLNSNCLLELLLHAPSEKEHSNQYHIME